MKIVLMLIIGFVLLSSAPSAHAIIILPALILIPLAQMLAVVVSVLTVPAVSMGILIAKIKKNKRLAIMVPLISLVILTLLAAAVLYWRNPGLPWL